jgi:tRNA A-37 threonylcarbamoyl transferase component Bud32
MEVIKVQSWNKRIIYQKQYDSLAMRALIANLDHALVHPCEILKDDDTSTVAVITVDDKRMVVKRANTKGWGHFFRRAFRHSRAFKNWDYAQRLKSINILTFDPIAVIEERFGPFRGRSYFLCNYLEGTEALHYFAYDALPQPSWPMVATEIVTLIKQLATAKLYHQDLNLSNIILIDNKPFLIDLDSMRTYRFGFSTKKILNKLWSRFMENWDEMPGVRPEVAPLFQSIFNKQYNGKVSC